MSTENKCLYTEYNKLNIFSSAITANKRISNSSSNKSNNNNDSNNNINENIMLTKWPRNPPENGSNKINRML